MPSAIVRRERSAAWTATTRTPSSRSFAAIATPDTSPPPPIGTTISRVVGRVARDLEPDGPLARDHVAGRQTRWISGQPSLSASARAASWASSYCPRRAAPPRRARAPPRASRADTRRACRPSRSRPRPRRRARRPGRDCPRWRRRCRAVEALGRQLRDRVGRAAQLERPGAPGGSPPSGRPARRERCDRRVRGEHGRSPGEPLEPGLGVLDVSRRYDAEKATARSPGTARP